MRQSDNPDRPTSPVRRRDGHGVADLRLRFSRDAIRDGWRGTSPAFAADSPGSGPIFLRDVTQMTGINWQHTDGGSGKRYIVETISAGMATLDYDGDGLIDIYFVNGALAERYGERRRAPQCALS